MSSVVPLILCLAGGAVVGASAAIVKFRPQLAAARAELADMRAQLVASGVAQQQIADFRQQASALRHDLRGILSPAMLTADRLVNSQDPAIRKSAEIVIRSVERATARLAENAPAQDGGKSDQA